MAREVRKRFDVPSTIYSDQGRHFKVHVLSEIRKLLRIKKIFTTTYQMEWSRSSRKCRGYISVTITLIGMVILPFVMMACSL